MNKKYHPLYCLATLAIVTQLSACSVSVNQRDTLSNKKHAYCTIDSSLYSVPYKFKSGEYAEVPLEDGSSVIFEMEKNVLSDIRINDGHVFLRCHKSTLIIEKWKQAKNILSLTRVKTFGKFIGTELAICNTVDEGWFFMYKKGTGYVGYAGPAELPLSVVGMRCD